MKLVSVYTYLDKVGGAENLCVALHNSLMQSDLFSQGSLSSFVAYKDIADSYQRKISQRSYQKFKLRNLLRKPEEVIFLSHHRKTTTYLLAASKLLGKKIHIVHIAHSTIESLKYATMFPKHVLAVSESVKQNHKEYFKLNNIEVIHNGVPKPAPNKRKTYDPKRIVVSVVASIYEGKQQIAITEFLKGKIPEQVQIQFAGAGPDYEQLKECIGEDKSFKALGHIEEVQSIYQNSDYVLLYSKAEGLPLSLLEAQSHAVPIICNDVGGNLEILHPEKNGFLTTRMQDLLTCLKELPKVSLEDYQKLQEHSLENFENNFQYDKMLEKYIEYLSKLLHRIKQV